ncbi:MAG: glycosyltransferase family 9 protein [Deltaproteobacteria bacterium]|nr:glycosyltransferase family 9 protein [Deltaproteobacteria bacterium]MBI3016853.1 glycosyltransferase family 9 protein [Deltaproteobacteria bacterium]
MSQAFQNILIVSHSNIGDILHNMAVLKPLKKMFPNASITILTSSIGKTILEGNSYITQTLTFGRFGQQKKLKERLKLIWQLRKKKFDLVINLKSGSYLPYFLAPTTIWGIQSQDLILESKRTIHAIDLYLNVLRSQGIPITPQDLDLKISYSLEDQQKINTLLKDEGYDFQKPIVVIAPFSAWHAKELSPSVLGELTKKLTTIHQMQVVVIGGKADQTKMETLKYYKDYFLDLVGKTTLKELAALYTQTRLAIGCDSGPFHLATNMGTPALGIFSATPHFRARPYFTPTQVVSCDVNLGCNPCIPGPNFMECKVWNRTTPCMEAIPFNQIYEKTKEILNFN